MIGDGKAKENTNSFVECTNVLLAHVADVLVVLKPVNSNTTGTITPMFSSYDWMKPNLCVILLIRE